MGAIMRAYNRLLSITQHESGFYRMSVFMSVLHELAASGNYRILSSTAPMAYSDSEPQRITVVKDYIINNYMSEIRLNTLAELAKMTPTAYSRFFKGRTGCSVSDFIIDIRLDYASRKLLDTNNHRFHHVDIYGFLLQREQRECCRTVYHCKRRPFF